MNEHLIENVWVDTVKLGMAAAELRITVVHEPKGKESELRVRLTGPRCRYSSTVEVAYRVRPGVKMPPEMNTRIYKVIIPEPNLWEPATPFLYHGMVELWQEDRISHQQEFYHGLRHLALGPAGMRLNGKPFALRGVARAFGPEEELLPMHQRGFDSLLVPGATADRWGLADELGFLVIGRLTSHEPMAVMAAFAHRDQPSTLGWLMTPAMMEQASLTVVGLLKTVSRSHRRCRFGLEVTSVPSEAPPSWVSFIACPEELLPLVDWIRLPKLILRKPGAPLGEQDAGTKPAPGVLGWIEE